MSQQLCFELLAEQMTSLWISHQPRCCGFLSILANAQIAVCTDSFLNILGNSNDQSLFRVPSALATTRYHSNTCLVGPAVMTTFSFTSGLIRQLPACALGGHTRKKHVTPFRALFHSITLAISSLISLHSMYTKVSSSR